MYKMNKKNSYKQRSATIMVLVGLMFIFFIPLISSFEFDNIKVYDKETKTVKIKNAFGLGEDIADITLNTPHEYIVPMGYQKIAEIELDSKQLEYLNVLSNMKLFDMRNNNKEFERQIDYKYLTTRQVEFENQKVVYDDKGENASHIEYFTDYYEEEYWEDFDFKNVKKGVYTIGLFMQINEYDKIEWIPTLYGVEIKEWAVVIQSSGTITYQDIGGLNYTTYTFTSNGTFNVRRGSLNISVLVVAGGGGASAGGGGAGGIIYEVEYDVEGNYDVVVGLGGPGGVHTNNGTNGQNSLFGELVAIGGGSGRYNEPGIDGGSGGGAGYGGSGVPGGNSLGGQGNSGGYGLVGSGDDKCGGGGGGAGAVGQNGHTSPTSGGDGGAGFQYDINGTNTYYGGGGGGGGYKPGSTYYSWGGIGGGGNGSMGGSGISGAPGIDGLGGGGGGNTGGSGSGGTGGKGVVVVRYLTSDVEIFPVVTLETPNNFTNFTTNEVGFECYVYDYVNDLANSSFILDDVYNETINNPVNATIQTFNKTLSEGIHNWTCEVCSNISACFTAGIFLLDVNTTPNIAFGIGVYPDYSNITNDFFNVNVTLTETFFKNVTFDLYLANGVLNQTETFTDATRSRNWTDLPDATYSYNVTTATTTNQFNNTATRNITIDTTSPAVNVFYPTENIEYQELNTNLSLNWSANDTNLDTCIYNYNTTNMTATCSDNQTNMNITDYTYTNVSFWVNDTFGHVTYTFIEWNYRLFLVSESFTTPVTEGSSNAFTINLRTNGSDITLGNLSYNNLQNFGTITETSTDNFTITKSIIAPPVTEETNYSFFWEISQNGLSYDFTPQNQTVTDIGIDNCSVNKIVLYNFTIVGEESQSKLSGTDANTTGKINLQLYNLLRTVTLTDYSSFFNETNPFYVCINASLLAEEKYVVDVQIEYDAGIYEKELYHIQNATINSTTINTNITLYDLLTANSQVFKLSARDTSFLALSDAIIEIHRKYVDEGTFKIVEIPKTDGKGETTAHLKTNDAIYNFIIKKFGVTISTFNNVLAVCQTPLVSPCVIDFNAISAGITIPDYEEDEDFSYTLGYDSATKIVTTEFIIPSGEATTVFLNVTRYDALGTAVCTDTLTSTAGTLSCVVPNSFGNATVIATLTKDGSYVASGTIKLNQDPSDIYGTSLIFLGLFVMLTLIGAAISDNPVYTIIFFMVGVILLFALNLVANNGFIGGTATILFLIVAIILVIIKGARRN